MIEIKNHWTGQVICTGETLQGAVLANRANLSWANLSRADLSRADLYGANLSRADLSRANLSRANLSRANLYGADLSRADLYGADLYGANLSWANLSRAKIVWQSHDLIAEILKRAAGDDVAKLKVAGYVLICRDKCWQHFISQRDPLAGWARGVLREWVTDSNQPPVEAREWLMGEVIHE